MIKKILITLLFISISPFSFAQESDDFEDEFAFYEKSFSSKSEEQIYDPFEKANRGIFYVNNKFDIYLAEPLAKGYRSFLPKIFRKSIRNFIVNLSLPLSALNSFAQGKLDNGLGTMSHFLINSTLGVGGIFNIAEKKNIKYNREDFGQTLAHYGAGPGPFLMLPIIGPSNLRDTTGLLADTSVNFMGFNVLEFGGSDDAVFSNDIRVGYSILIGIDNREALIDVIEDARKDSFDFYAAMRSLYIQNRNSKIKE